MVKKMFIFKLCVICLLNLFSVQIVFAYTQNGNALYFNQDEEAAGAFNVADGTTLNLYGVGNNKVLWNDNSGFASNIGGTLNLYDILFALVNTNGINIGLNGAINAANSSLILSSLRINSNDFFNNNFKFYSESGDLGKIVNNGTINGAQLVALIGHAIENNGAVMANVGKIAIGAAGTGSNVTLTMDAQGQIGIIISDPLLIENIGEEALFKNTGNIIADGGQVVISAQAAKESYIQAVNNTGVIRARSLQNNNGAISIVGKGGNIEVGQINGTNVSIASDGKILEGAFGSLLTAEDLLILDAEAGIGDSQLGRAIDFDAVNIKVIDNSAESIYLAESPNDRTQTVDITSNNSQGIIDVFMQSGNRIKILDSNVISRITLLNGEKLSYQTSDGNISFADDIGHAGLNVSLDALNGALNTFDYKVTGNDVTLNGALGVTANTDAGILSAKADAGDVNITEDNQVRLKDINASGDINIHTGGLTEIDNVVSAQDINISTSDELRDANNSSLVSAVNGTITLQADKGIGASGMGNAVEVAGKNLVINDNTGNDINIIEAQDTIEDIAVNVKRTQAVSGEKGNVVVDLIGADKVNIGPDNTLKQVRMFDGNFEYLVYASCTIDDINVLNNIGLPNANISLITVSGKIFGAGEIVADELVLSSALGIGNGPDMSSPMNINANYLEAEATSIGSIYIRDYDSLTVRRASTLGGIIDIKAGGDLEIAKAESTAPLLTGLNDGDMDYFTEDNIVIGYIDAGNADIDLNTGDSVLTTPDPDIDIIADEITIISGGTIGSGNANSDTAMDTDVNNLTAIAQNDVVIDEVNDLVIGEVTSVNGDIYMNVGGNLTQDGDASADIVSQGDVNLNIGGSMGDAANPIDTDVENLHVDGEGPIYIDEKDDISIDSQTDLLIGFLSADHVDLYTDYSINTPNFNVPNFSVNSVTAYAGNDIYLFNDKAITGDITADTLYIKAFGGIDLITKINLLFLENLGSGDVSVKNQGDLVIGKFDVEDGSARIESDSKISTQEGAVINAEKLALYAGQGIDVVIEAQELSFENTGDGDVIIENKGQEELVITKSDNLGEGDIDIKTDAIRLEGVIKAALGDIRLRPYTIGQPVGISDYNQKFNLSFIDVTRLDAGNGKIIIGDKNVSRVTIGANEAPVFMNGQFVEIISGGEIYGFKPITADKLYFNAMDGIKAEFITDQIEALNERSGDIRFEQMVGDMNIGPRGIINWAGNIYLKGPASIAPNGGIVDSNGHHVEIIQGRDGSIGGYYTPIYIGASSITIGGGAKDGLTANINTNMTDFEHGFKILYGPYGYVFINGRMMAAYPRSQLRKFYASFYGQLARNYVPWDKIYCMKYRQEDYFLELLKFYEQDSHNFIDTDFFPIGEEFFYETIVPEGKPVLLKAV